ncbi:MAG: cupin domain-containing protein [Fretibacterium sp.]
MDKKDLEQMVRKAVQDILGGVQKDPAPCGAPFEKRRVPAGAVSVKLPTVRPEKFDTGKPGDKVRLIDVLTLEESPRLGCGIMEMEATAFDWTLRYDEVDYIIEGTLEILIDGQTVTGNKGDALYIPADSSITFRAPAFARFLYVTYPANWAAQ